MNRLLIISPDSRTLARRLEARQLPHLSMVHTDDVAQARQLCRDCNIILGQPAWVAGVLNATTALAWVQSTFAGVEPLCARGMPTGYVLTGVKEVFGAPISEYVFAYILARERHLFETFENQKKVRWEKPPYNGLGGATLGVCGLGSIGEHVARTANHFGMQVLGYNRTGRPNAHVQRVFSGPELGDFLARLDYLVMTLPDTPLTRGLLDFEALRRMKPTAVVINVGRGSGVSEKDLIRALQEGKIGGAVLDVFETEPLPADSPLWTMSNVFVTPHNAAVSLPEMVIGIFCDNYRRFAAGQPLRYTVDFERGY